MKGAEPPRQQSCCAASPSNVPLVNRSSSETTSSSGSDRNIVDTRNASPDLTSVESVRNVNNNNNSINNYANFLIDFARLSSSPPAIALGAMHRVAPPAAAATSNVIDDDRIRVAFQTRMGEQMVRMTSTLVETVSINYEDFNESFLTCGTCLCTYDGSEHTPKLLQCSHTVCLQCLGRIAATAAPPASSASSAMSTTAATSTPREAPATFRCPICRELINIPRGGVSALPPSFLVNQLLDLMASQRREVVPKCSTHSNQELLFCETCDSVFCAVCMPNPHTSVQTGDHTVIPFSIAIKRMSEILTYKANECMTKLDEATESIVDETRRLDCSLDDACAITNNAFQLAIDQLEKRRQTYLTKLREVAAAKKEKLQEQLELINKERNQVKQTCDGLEYQVEVRYITKKISELSSQLDSFSSLRHPRENAYLQCKTECDFKSLDTVIGAKIITSSTFPSLCSLRLDSDAICSVGVPVDIILETRDYHNLARKEGGDPIEVQVTANGNLVFSTKPVPGGVDVEDRDDGTYLIAFTPKSAGSYKVQVSVFGRSIKEDEFSVGVDEHNNPLKTWGRGELCQPVGVAEGEEEIFILDTGNSRVVVVDTALSIQKRVLQNFALEGNSCTGICYCSFSKTLLVANWRTKLITRISAANGDTISTVQHDGFDQPVCIAVDSKGQLLVADIGSSSVYVFDSCDKHLYTVKKDKFNVAGGVAVLPNGKAVVAADSTLYQLSDISNTPSPGKSLTIEKEIVLPGKGRIGGVAADTEGRIIVTRTEKTKSFVQVLQEGKVVTTIDSFASKLKRPSDLTVLGHKNVVVVDLGNDCVKQFRYK